MLKSISLVFLFSLIFLNFTHAVDEKKYGKEISSKEETKISAILENPSDYMNKKVLIKGEVIDVCKKAGCWMEISSDKKDQKIKVKVKDGEIVFPLEAIGKQALVEGEVYAIELDEEEAKEYFEHLAEDAGKEFDESTVKGPVTIYQIRGIGAKIIN
jgi:hypothetical protein